MGEGEPETGGGGDTAEMEDEEVNAFTGIYE